MKRTMPIATIVTMMALFSFSAGPSWAATKPCPTNEFPDLSNSVGAGSGYSKPSISVSCTKTKLNVSSNGMISFTFDQKTPNALSTQDWKWSVPLNPAKAKSVTSIKNVLGTIGFTVTGLPIYGPTEGPQPTAEAFGDPVFNKIVDQCAGHTGPAREYHHHAITLIKQCNLSKQSVLGYALDGFPIYTTLGCLNKKCTKTTSMKSGYTRVGDPTKNAWDAYAYKTTKSRATLDSCNGRTQPDGSYGYHATTDFPYIIGCFTGTATLAKGRAGQPMPPMR